MLAWSFVWITGAKIDFGLKELAHNLRKLARAWAKSSFFDNFFLQEQPNNFIRTLI